MKKVKVCITIATILIAIMLTACGNTYRTDENVELSDVKQKAAEKFLMDSIPEIKKYNEYIEKKSGGNAELIIDIEVVRTSPSQEYEIIEQKYLDAEEHLIVTKTEI